MPFEAAARLGSFTRAAGELNLTQAAISRQIRNLEADLGCALFERRNRKAVLTEDGQAFAATVAEALDGLADHAGRLRSGRAAREVILFAQLCEAYYWILPRLGGFREEAPDIHVNVVASSRPLSEFDGAFDLAFQISARRAGSLRPILTVEDEVFALCSPSFLAARGGEALSLSALTRAPLLNHASYAVDGMGWSDWFGRLGIERLPGTAREEARYDDYLFMVQAAVEGRGIILGWRRTMASLLRAGALVRASAPSVTLPDALSVYRRAATKSAKDVSRVADWLRRELAQQN